MASSLSSTAPPWQKYDVFLSFRGPDTRFGFTSHLYAALDREKIVTFIDDSLEEGDGISEALERTIENSMISVIIFSPKYAESRWCLDELVKIFECKEKNGQSVLPVFYLVEPTHVRHQTGSFGVGFDTIEERYVLAKLLTWRKTLRKAADLSGFDSNAIRNEADLVENIVKRVLEVLNRKSSHYNNDLIGVQSSIKNIESLLNIKSEESLRIVGIWGMGGIGKTFLGNEVFNRNKKQFNKTYREISDGTRSENLKALQQRILSAILNNQNADINEEFIKNQLCRTRVLIFLDDLKYYESIKDLISCLSSRSRVIMTNRDKKVLQNYGVSPENIYKVEKLNDEDALQLFSRSLGKTDSISNFHCLSKKIVKYAKGVPLALIELGKHLVNKDKEDTWRSFLGKLEVYPKQEIQDVLESSYDGLDDTQRKIFLDIACFLRWEEVDLVTNFLVACNLFPEDGISVLIDRCLIFLSNNKITMHDLLQIMGLEIVRQESRKYPGERSRLCCHNEICDVLRKNTGTKAIRSICLDISKIQDINVHPDAFREMKNLEVFKLHNSHSEEKNVDNDFQGLQSVELRYLCWYGCPLKSLPLSFHNLVVLHMTHSKVEEFWTSNENFDNLKHINLSYSQHLREIKALKHVKNLESLTLEGCTKLHVISQCIEQLSKLVMLNLRQCKSLENLPNICNMKSLQDLHLLECSKLNQNAVEDKIKEVLHKIEHPEEKSYRKRCICFTGTEEIPGRFTPRSGSSIMLKRPDDWVHGKLVCFALCAVLGYENYNNDQGLEVCYEFRYHSHVLYRGTLRCWEYGKGPRFVDKDQVFLCYESQVSLSDANNCFDEMTIQFFVKDSKSKPIETCKVKRCGFLSLSDVENHVDNKERQCKKLRI